MKKFKNIAIVVIVFTIISNFLFNTYMQEQISSDRLIFKILIMFNIFTYVSIIYLIIYGIKKIKKVLEIPSIVLIKIGLYSLLLFISYVFLISADLELMTTYEHQISGNFESFFFVSIGNYVPDVEQITGYPFMYNPIIYIPNFGNIIGLFGICYEILKFLYFKYVHKDTNNSKKNGDDLIKFDRKFIERHTKRNLQNRK